MANVGALDQVRSFLREHPDAHNQSEWNCGTAGCVGGWTIALAECVEYGTDLDDLFSRWPAVGEVSDRAQRLLGLTDDEADAVFYLSVHADDPEAEALALIDAVIAREKDDLTDEQRRLLAEYGLGVGT